MYYYHYEFRDYGDECTCYVVIETYAPDFSDYRRDEEIGSFATEAEARDMIKAMQDEHAKFANQ